MMASRLSFQRVSRAMWSVQRGVATTQVPRLAPRVVPVSRASRGSSWAAVSIGGGFAAVGIAILDHGDDTAESNESGADDEVTQQPHCDCSGGVSREPEDDGTELAESDEEPQFNRDHYSKGLNANFLCGTTDEVVGLHAGEGGEGGGRFENVETRDIARGLPAVLSAISSVARLDGATVADIGAGTGLFLEPFRRSVGDRGSVYAVELSEHFCKHLAKKAKQNPRGAPVKVVQCTDTETRLPTASVDVAFICDVYHHFEYPKTFMKSLMTSMKPGGTVVVVDFHRDEAKITSHPPGWITAHVRADQATFRAEIESAGFTYVKDLEVVELQENYVMVFRK